MSMSPGLPHHMGAAHPAAGMSRQVVRAFGPRDQLETAPESCDDAEGEILFALANGHRYRPGDAQRPACGRWISVRGRAPEEKLPALRCRWWCWAGGSDLVVGPLTPLGHSVLGDWLRAKELAGEAVAAERRQALFPDADDLAREAAEAEEQRRREDLRHRRFLLRSNYSHLVRVTQQQLDAIEARMLAIAYQIAAGANDLTGHQVQLRRCGREAAAARAQIAQLRAAWDGVPAQPDDAIPPMRSLAAGEIPELAADVSPEPAEPADRP